MKNCFRKNRTKSRLFHVKQCPENMDILDPRGGGQRDPAAGKRDSVECAPEMLAEPADLSAHGFGRTSAIKPGWLHVQARPTCICQNARGSLSVSTSRPRVPTPNPFPSHKTVNPAHYEPPLRTNFYPRSGVSVNTIESLELESISKTTISFFPDLSIGAGQ